MLNEQQQSRIDRLIMLSHSLRFFTKDYKTAIEFNKKEPEHIKYIVDSLQELFEYNELNKLIYEYNDNFNISVVANEFMIIIKNEVFKIIKDDYDSGWLTITEDNHEEISKDLLIQLNKF